MQPIVPAGAVGMGVVAPQHDLVYAQGHADSNTNTREGTIDTLYPEVEPSGTSKSGSVQAEEPVDVGKAEAQFETLRRELTRRSTLHRTQTRQVDDNLEKGGVSDVDEFDLLSYLRGEQSEAEKAGFKRKVLGVAWKGLTVVGAGGMKIHIRTFPDAIKESLLFPIIKIAQLAGAFKGTPKNLLEDFDGCLKPGEMCLVLGRPGSGCTTFLKTIANNRGGYQAVHGDVSYGGITAAEMAKRYRGEVVYNQEDDVHAATLTVAQTLLFALRLKTPGKLLPGQSRGEFRQEVMSVLLKMLGIPHTKNTKVGSAFVRGVSGGERKRVSIAEMMVARGAVCSWDNSTRGLDASTALDYAKSLRILTDVHSQATIVTLYQASEGIFEQFDKVLLIDQGQQVYFGPTKEARQYMMSLGYADLPRQTTPDYLTGCTDENERRLASDRTEADVPSTPSELAAAYKKSHIYARMVAERDQFLEQCEVDAAARREFEEAVVTDKRRGVSKKSVYTASFLAQVWALTIRQFQLKAQDRVDLGVSWTTTIVVALIAGSVYFQLPQTASGAFTRGGAIFMGLLFNAFQGFNELPSQMLGRAIVQRHRQFAFYRPSAVTIAGQLADLPNSLLQMAVFSTILYLMVGLVYDAGAWFTYYLIVVAGYLSVASLFRLFGTICGNYDQASRLASAVVTVLILYSGYLVPIFSQKRWLFWLSYLNPVQFAFSSAMSNEFKRIDLTCDSNYIFPHNIGSLAIYPDGVGPNQVCTIAGSVAGSAVVRGRDYIYQSFQYEIGQQWRQWGICLVFWFGFSVIQALLAEKLKHGADMPAINIFAKENKERKDLNESLQKNKLAFRRGEVEQADLGDIAHTRPFTWEDLTYTVPVPGGQRQLLDHVFGYVKPGQLTALMGSSGAGKTTLLDVLANRKTIGVIGGERLIGGRQPGKAFQSGAAYCEQADVHEATATVREAMRFSAYLRQPAHVPKAEKDAYVEQMIQLLELEDKADAMIGFPGFGLDVEARKRVTIGVELAAKPRMLLFLDEPTSGLDSQSAYNIVRFLRKLAAAGQAILVTIHQPNALLFENFDRLLLLKAGGRTVYFGDIGKDSRVVREYLASHGAICPSQANPAEFMLEAIGAGSGKAIGGRDWADLWLESPQLEQVKRDISQLNKESLAKAEDDDPSLSSEYATPFWHQLQVVSSRTFLAFWRSPDYGFTRLFNHGAIALAVGLTFLNLDNSASALQYRVFAIFFITIIPAIIMAQIEPMYIFSRQTFIRESSSKMYSEFVFSLSQLAAETPYSILCAVVFYLLLYWPIGLSSESNRAGYAFAFILLVEFFAVTMGQAVAALAPTMYAAQMTNPFLLIIFALFCGVTVPPPSIPHFWRSWLYHLNPFTYIVSGLVSNELHDLKIECRTSEFRTFQPPAGQTCADWAGPYVALAGGYLADDTGTSDCQYCQYARGDEFYAPLGISFTTRGRNIGVFVAYVAFNGFVTVVASRLLKYSKR
ncbi:hypothetical protein JCM1841_003594 [Sporobolomyces salmonicolor]